MHITALSLFSGSEIIARLLAIPGMVLFFCFRGFFQAWVAKKLGDHLPARNGFLTMNPKAHIDLIGFILLVILGFGFGKPIVFDKSVYKHPKRDGAIQILSAPAAGIILAFAAYLVYFVFNVIGKSLGIAENVVYSSLTMIFFYTYYYSLFLTVFLFLPLPGFGLYNLIVNFLPYNVYRKLYVIEKYSMIIYIAFIVLLNVPVIGDFLYYYLLYIPFSALSFVVTYPFVLFTSLTGIG